MCVGLDRVLFKQRDNRFFPASAYALALLLVRVPFQLAEAALYTVVVYFWVGACSCSPPFCQCLSSRAHVPPLKTHLSKAVSQ